MAAIQTTSSADCGDEPSKLRPLCRSDLSDSPGTTQHWGKAYPSPRVLEVMKGFGENSIPASICPKIHDEGSRDFGYNPAVAAIIDRLAEKLGGQCLPRELDVNEEGLVDCVAIEALPIGEGDPLCQSEGRGELPNSQVETAQDYLLETNWCSSKDECKEVTLCAIEQFPLGSERDACLSTARGQEDSLAPGFCYADPELGFGKDALVAGCPATQRRLLRFVGEETPASGSATLVLCQGDLKLTDSVSQIPPTP